VPAFAVFTVGASLSLAIVAVGFTKEQPIVVDARALEEGRKTLQSTVQIDLEGVPLKTTVRLLLKQLDLAYTIKDGLVIVSSPEIIQNLGM
jgi:hypothetical protein